MLFRGGHWWRCTSVRGLCAREQQYADCQFQCCSAKNMLFLCLSEECSALVEMCPSGWAWRQGVKACRVLISLLYHVQCAFLGPFRGVLSTGGDAPQCLGFVPGSTSLQIVPGGPDSASQALYCGFNPATLLAGAQPQTVFSIQSLDGMFSTIKTGFGETAPSITR